MVNVLLGNTSLEKWINVEHCKGRWSFKCFPNSRISSSVSQFSQVSLKISPFPSFPARSFVESLFYWQSLECMVNIQEWIKTQFQDRILLCIWYEVINQAKDVQVNFLLSSSTSQFPFLPIPILLNSHSYQFLFLLSPNHPLNSLSLPVVSGSQGLGQGQWSLCEYGFQVPISGEGPYLVPIFWVKLPLDRVYAGVVLV